MTTKKNEKHAEFGKFILLFHNHLLTCPKDLDQIIVKALFSTGGLKPHGASQ